MKPPVTCDVVCVLESATWGASRMQYQLLLHLTVRHGGILSCAHAHSHEKIHSFVYIVTWESSFLPHLPTSCIIFPICCPLLHGRIPPRPAHCCRQNVNRIWANEKSKKLIQIKEYIAAWAATRKLAILPRKLLCNLETIIGNDDEWCANTTTRQDQAWPWDYLVTRFNTIEVIKATFPSVLPPSCPTFWLISCSFGVICLSCDQWHARIPALVNQGSIRHTDDKSTVVSVTWHVGVVTSRLFRRLNRGDFLLQEEHVLRRPRGECKVTVVRAKGLRPLSLCMSPWLYCPLSWPSFACVDECCISSRRIASQSNAEADRQTVSLIFLSPICSTLIRSW